MAEYSVTTTSSIDFGATGTAEVLQNVKMIIGTMAYSCPMARDFAWTPPVDDPINVQRAKTVARIVSAIKAYEPRATVTDVSFEADGLAGQIVPTVKVYVEEG